MSKKTSFDISLNISRKKNKLPPNPESSCSHATTSLGRFPSWLHRKIPQGSNLAQTRKIIKTKRLFTVCEEARCPNLMECYSKKTATFLAMGKECTRACSFCDISHSPKPSPLDPNEPQNISDSIGELNLKHAVITMVSRDDLQDGGAKHLADIIHCIEKNHPSVKVEVLTSDFGGNENAYDTVIKAKPHVFNHNLETVKELTAFIRHRAKYERSLATLEYVKKNSQGILIKSGLMLGIGENEKQVEESLKDLYKVGCDIVTLGQYLQASPQKMRIKSFISPQEFENYKHLGLSIGIKQMFCGPFVRSSYNAGELLS